MQKHLIYGAAALFFFTKTCLFAQFPNYYSTHNQTPTQQSAVVAPRTVTPSAVQTNPHVGINQNALPQGYAPGTPAMTSPMQLPAFQQQQVLPQYQTSAPIQQGFQQSVPATGFQTTNPAIPQYGQPPVNTQPVQQNYYQTIAQPVPQYQQYQQHQQHQQQAVNHVATASHQPGVQDSYREATQLPQMSEHPLMPVIHWAKRERPRVAGIRDYTAILRKQENISGKLQDGNIMEVKIRHEPFSVYLRFIAPKNVDGQEVLYIQGENNGKMWAHGVGLYKLAGTQLLDPLHPRAMAGCRYPLTYIGILNLLDKLLEVGEHDSQYGNCNVFYYENVKMGNRQCLCIEVVHPDQYDRFRFHLARIYVDNEHNLPIRYESYDWPKGNGQKPELLEAYSYDNLKINVGLTDEDFNILNKNYNF